MQQAMIIIARSKLREEKKIFQLFTNWLKFVCQIYNLQSIHIRILLHYLQKLFLRYI